VGLAQDVRWTRQAVDERVVMRLLKDVQSARLTTPRWRWYRRWHQRRLIALLQLAFVAYKNGLDDAPKARDVAKRHLAMLGMVGGPRNN